MDVRKSWFEHRPGNENLNYLVQLYHTALHNCLQELLMKEKFYLPPNSNLRISRNIALNPSGKFSVSRQGMPMPGFVTRLHPKIPKLLNRVNTFVFHVPAEQRTCPEIILKRHEFISKLIRYQQSYLPHFIPTAFGLNILKPQE